MRSYTDVYSLSSQMPPLTPRLKRQGHDEHVPPQPMNLEAEAINTQEARLSQIGTGLLLAGSVLALTHYEDITKLARNTLRNEAKLPKWLQRQDESSALLTMNPMTWLKSLGLMGGVSLINKGLGLALPAPVLALELGAAFHSLIPGTIGMKTAHFMTMAPLLAGSALIASTAHHKTDAYIDTKDDWSPSQRELARATSGLVTSGVMAAGAMALFPRVHLGLMELRDPFAKASKLRPLWGGEKGWYINTVHHVDGLVNGVRESVKQAWTTRDVKGLKATFEKAYQMPFLEQGHPDLKGKDNYYKQNVPSMSRNSKGVEQYLYQILRSVPETATSQAYKASVLNGKPAHGVRGVRGEGVAKAFQPYLQAELKHLGTQNFDEKVDALMTSLNTPEHKAWKTLHEKVSQALAEEDMPEIIRPAIVAEHVLQEDAIRALEKDDPIRQALRGVAFHGRPDEAYQYELKIAQHKAELKHQAELKAEQERLEALQEEWEDMEYSLQNAQSEAQWLEKQKHLNEYLTTQAESDYIEAHRNAVKELGEHATPQAIAKKRLEALEENNPSKISQSSVNPNLNPSQGSLLSSGSGFLGSSGRSSLDQLANEFKQKKKVWQKEAPLRELYTQIATHQASGAELKEMEQLFHVHSANCGHGVSSRVNETSFNPSNMPSHAHACDDPTHHHAPIVSHVDVPEAQLPIGDGGDFFHLEMWYKMRKALEQKPLTVDFEGTTRLGGRGTLESLANHWERSPDALARGNSLEKAFSRVNKDLAQIRLLHQQGHLAPDTEQNIRELLLKNKWTPEEANAFITNLKLYIDKAEHINGHNPQVVKAWAIMAGVGGAVCANGCCAGSIFCLNEAVALAGSLYSSVSQSLGEHKEKRHKKQTKQTASST